MQKGNHAAALKNLLLNGLSIVVINIINKVSTSDEIDKNKTKKKLSWGSSYSKVSW